MHVAVLLISLSEHPRRTTFTRDWAQRCVEVAGEYYAAQSAGQVALSWNVYDWVELPMDEKAWSALSTTGIDDLIDAVTPLLPAGSDLRSGVDHVLVGIDSPNSSGGTTPGHFTYLGAVNFTPSFIGHEFGHRFGVGDAFGKAADGRRRYHHPYCVMGAEGWPQIYTDPRLLDGAPMLAGTGPGMSVPTLLATRWLDPGRHHVVADLTGSADLSYGASVTLSALAGAPGVSWSGPPVAARVGDLVVEYRVAAGWDRGIDVYGGARGKVVVNVSPPTSPVAELVDDVDANPGALLSIGPDHPFDLGSPGPLVIRVLSEDAQNDVVHLSLRQRAPRPGLSGIGVGPGWGSDAGGFVWTPGRGLQRIPPYSPLHDALVSLGELAALQELAVNAPDELAEPIRERGEQALADLRGAVEATSVDRAPSPVERAVVALAALEEARRGFETDANRDGRGEAYLDLGRSTIPEVIAVLESALREERRPSS